MVVVRYLADRSLKTIALVRSTAFAKMGRRPHTFMSSISYNAPSNTLFSPFTSFAHVQKSTFSWETSLRFLPGIVGRSNQSPLQALLQAPLYPGTTHKRESEHASSSRRFQMNIELRDFTSSFRGVVIWDVCGNTVTTTHSSFTEVANKSRIHSTNSRSLSSLAFARRGTDKWVNLFKVSEVSPGADRTVIISEGWHHAGGGLRTRICVTLRARA